MKIKLLDSYKSLSPFESEELDDLTIITGKNGSGKTQLLGLIGKKSANDQSVISTRLEISPKGLKVQYEGLKKENTVEISYGQWSNIIQEKYKIYTSIKENSWKLIRFIRQQKLPMERNSPLASQEIEYFELLGRSYAELTSTAMSVSKGNAKHTQNAVFQTLFSPRNLRLFRFIDHLCRETGKMEHELEMQDFYNAQIHESLIDSDELFSSKIELIFYNYAKRRYENRLAFFAKKEDGDTNNSISDQEFLAVNIPPWEMINEIFAKHDIDFYFKEIPKKFSPDLPLKFAIVKKSENKEIEIVDLSSGEKVIIGLILTLFTSEYYNTDLKFPGVLVLDEPDATLHPQMCKLLIDVLHEKFVKKHGIKVIFSTHSPSTIALSPENSIYELKNGANTSLKKISKDEALKLLTNFIPTLSIDYRNHRQIFVESPIDVAYYQALQDKHSQSKKLDYKLYLISNSAGKGNCTQVYNIVKSLRDSGNGTSYGIVDWDTKNDPAEYVFVHGFNERYSVENFIADPIYIITLLIQMNNAHQICELTGIHTAENEYLIGHKPNEELQIICDKFFAALHQKYPQTGGTSELVDIKYLNEKTLRFPKWYLTNKGHDIIEKLNIVFYSLSKKFPNESLLLKELISIMVKSYPFVPLSSVQLIEELATHSFAL